MSEEAELQRRFPKFKLWLVLVLTMIYCSAGLVASHLTHSLTLLVEAYHSVYNILSLGGCLVAIKASAPAENLMNTFGWARMEVISMLSTLLFLTALCFSVSVESVQTIVHAGHQDAMHHPLPVLGVAVSGLVLNILVYALIGGYTHHQGCFLEMRESGVWARRTLSQETVETGGRTISASRTDTDVTSQRPIFHEGVRAVMRDISGVVLVMLCAAVVYWDGGGQVALYTDPILAVCSVVVLMVLSTPFAWECGQILLQTIPEDMDIENLATRLLESFPAIVNIHHLHIWSLMPNKVVVTAHVVYSSPRAFQLNVKALRSFFLQEGVTQVTLQPEFLLQGKGFPQVWTAGSEMCLLRCLEECKEKQCCRTCSNYHTPEDDLPKGVVHRKGGGTPRGDVITSQNGKTSPRRSSVLMDTDTEKSSGAIALLDSGAGLLLDSSHELQTTPASPDVPETRPTTCTETVTTADRSDAEEDRSPPVPLSPQPGLQLLGLTSNARINKSIGSQP
ncbi:zinc transporter 77C isoform X2 [Oratosquilla oratoria]|uniref:zinc transporter 77C isoform X2 n=1 Tax=Oratosquilla oratoria TaxID=337810 RepID=UPI003F76DF24